MRRGAVATWLAWRKPKEAPEYPAFTMVMMRAVLRNCARASFAVTVDVYSESEPRRSNSASFVITVVRKVLTRTTERI